MSKAAPKRLTAKAKGKWTELAPAFVLATAIDVEVLAQACEQWAIYIDCQEAIKEHGVYVEQTNGVIGANGCIKAGKDALNQMHKLLLMLTPATTEEQGWE